MVSMLSVTCGHVFELYLNKICARPFAFWAEVAEVLSFWPEVLKMKISWMTLERMG